MPRLKTTFTPVVFTWGLQIQLQSSGILYVKLLKIAFLLIIFLKLDLSTFWVTWMTILTSDFRVPFSSYIDNCWPSSPFHFQCQLFNPVFKFKKHCCIWASPYVISSENQHDVVRWTYLWGQKYLSLTLPMVVHVLHSTKVLCPPWWILTKSLPIHHGFHPWDCAFLEKYFYLTLTKVM